MMKKRNSKINIFVATGNKDKLKRIKRWLGEYEINYLSPNDLDPSLAEKTKTTDEEEKEIAKYTDRAKFKVQKAKEVLKNEYDNLFILGMDDTAYFPWIDKYILDLRMPPEIIFEDKKINAINKRLSGAELGNYYVDLVELSATDEQMKNELALFNEDKLPEYKFMPVEWWFALAIGNTAGVDVEDLAEWKITEYIRNQRLPDDLEDNGYVLGSIASLHPLGDAKLIGSKFVEAEPREALRSFLGLD